MRRRVQTVAVFVWAGFAPLAAHVSQAGQNGCAALRGRSCVATHIDACVARRRCLPIAMRDSVVRGIDRVDPFKDFHHGLLESFTCSMDIDWTRTSDP